MARTRDEDPPDDESPDGDAYPAPSGRGSSRPGYGKGNGKGKGKGKGNGRGKGKGGRGGGRGKRVRDDSGDAPPAAAKTSKTVSYDPVDPNLKMVFMPRSTVENRNYTPSFKYFELFLSLFWSKLVASGRSALLIKSFQEMEIRIACLRILMLVFAFKAQLDGRLIGDWNVEWLKTYLPLLRGMKIPAFLYEACCCLGTVRTGDGTVLHLELPQIAPQDGIGNENYAGAFEDKYATSFPLFPYMHSSLQRIQLNKSPDEFYLDNVADVGDIDFLEDEDYEGYITYLYPPQTSNHYVSGQMAGLQASGGLYLSGNDIVIDATTNKPPLRYVLQMQNDDTWGATRIGALFEGLEKVGIAMATLDDVALAKEATNHSALYVVIPKFEGDEANQTKPVYHSLRTCVDEKDVNLLDAKVAREYMFNYLPADDQRIHDEENDGDRFTSRHYSPDTWTTESGNYSMRLVMDAKIKEYIKDVE